MYYIRFFSILQYKKVGRIFLPTMTTHRWDVLYFCSFNKRMGKKLLLFC